MIELSYSSSSQATGRVWGGCAVVVGGHEEVELPKDAKQEACWRRAEREASLLSASGSIPSIRQGRTNRFYQSRDCVVKRDPL